MATDLAAIGIGLYAAYWLRFHSALTHVFPIRNGYDPIHYLEILPFAWIIWLLALRFENLYRRRSRAFDFNVVRRIITGSCLALLILLAFNFYQSDRERVMAYSRLVSVIMLAAVIGALILNRWTLHYLFRWMMSHRGVGQSRTIVVGGGPGAVRLYRSLLRHPEFGMLPIGIVLGKGDADPSTLPPEVEVLGRSDALEDLLKHHHADEVILIQTEIERDRLEDLIDQCERTLAVFRIVPDATDLLLSGMMVETLDGIPLLGLRETPLTGWNAALKRMIDFAVAGVCLILTAPLVALFAWLIRRQDGYAPFFQQERMGVDGRRFRIVKLRTMRPEAEDNTGPVFATDFDPRCTRLGHFLRRAHLDELPQLLNVLRGEMSLVGPRPERPYFVEQFRDHIPQYMARHKVKSGITGWAQVNGLCGLHGSIDERLKYDMYYIEHWSLWLDVKILALTMFGRFKTGAVGN